MSGLSLNNNIIRVKIDDETIKFDNSGNIAVKTVDTEQLASGAVTTDKIADDNVTYDKIQDITTSNSVLGNTGTGTVAERALVGDILLDEDDMTSDSAINGATQQSIKAYVDSNGITQTSGTAPYYGIRAWVRFQGTGTPQILKSGNISGEIKVKSICD